ncbi:MAG: DUF5107 domain-containing protein [Planctomycetia bacterium]|nr:DUF5107 domain-containing protein [Planctomycetia bacterium]
MLLIMSFIVLTAGWSLSNSCVFAAGTDKEKTLSTSVTEESITLPTYEIGPPDLNPIYYTGRVYQGAQGHVYPYAMYDRLTDNKVEKSYRALFLENEYLKIGIVPDLGGRILQATDKTNNYEFFYRQHVVKPALIGMIGAWISGGVEWNIPHHHRPSTFMPIDWSMKAEEDGSKIVYVGETELRHRMKWSVAMKVYPGKALLEAEVVVMNRSPLPQSMLSWANVSVHCNEEYQVIFPPSVQYGTGHAKIDFVNWPIHNGLDYSMWKNHTDQFRSVFAWDFKEDFLAGYDHGKEAGTVHFANHHVVGGKKFFLWGNHDRAKMWDKMLTDDDGCYLELMVGAWSDNQPDYSWIGPGEVRSFKHYWFPISGIKHVKNANLNGAVNVARESDESVFLGYSPVTQLVNARLSLTGQGRELWSKVVDTEPGRPITEVVPVPRDLKDHELRFQVQNEKGEELIAYTPVLLEKEEMPEPVRTAGDPKKCKTNEELYLAGLRLEQFHNAQLDPMIYYGEALARDPEDARVNTAVGLGALRMGKWEEAEHYFRTAIRRLGHNYTVLKDGEPHYYLGLALRGQGRDEEATDQFWKASWTTSYQASAFYQLAELAAKQNDWHNALERVDQSLAVNNRDSKALCLKAWLLRRSGRPGSAELLEGVLQKDPLDLAAAVEMSFLEKGDASDLAAIDKRRGADLIRLQELVEVAVDYMNRGAWDDAHRLLQEAISTGAPYAGHPMIWYYAGWCELQNINSREQALASFAKASSLSSDYLFPFRVEERALFDAVLSVLPEDAQAHYAYGNLLYYLKDYDKAIAQWEESSRIRPEFGRVWRNLGFAAGRNGNMEEAIKFYETALKYDSSDPRTLTELDILSAGVGRPARQRLDIMERHIQTVIRHDDSVVRLIGLYNETGQCDKSIDILEKRHFHVWEGGRAIHDLFVDAHLIRGLRNRDAGRYEEAISDFQAAQTYPANLEVGRTNDGGQNAKTLYFLGTTLEKKGDQAAAQKAYERAVSPENKPTQLSSELTFYCILAWRKLGHTEEATQLLNQYSLAVEEEATRQREINEFSKFGEEGTASERQALVYFHRGLVALAAGKPEQMTQEFEQALRYNPNLIWPPILQRENW